MIMTEPIPALGERIRQLRHAAGMTQQSLAVAAGLSISVVVQLENGLRDDPRISTVAALARALGVTIDELIPTTGQGEPPPAKKTPRKRKEK
jgi:transcriptional regulator with XRE-family HTH domain